MHSYVRRGLAATVAAIGVTACAKPTAPAEPRAAVSSPTFGKTVGSPDSGPCAPPCPPGFVCAAVCEAPGPVEDVPQADGETSGGRA